MNVMNNTPEAMGASAPRGLADVLGFTALMLVIRRRMPLIAGVGAAAAVAAFAIVMLQPRTYTAASLLLITPHQELSAQDAAAAAATGAPSAVDSEIELLRSPALMDDLAGALGMQSANATSAVETNLASIIDIHRRSNTGVVEIRARASTAERAQLIANAYADVYLASQLNAHVSSDQQSNTLAWERLAELRSDAQEAEGALEAYRAEAGLDDNATAQAAMGDMQSQVQSAQAELADRQARQRRVEELRQSGASLDTLAGVLNSAALNSLMQRSAELSRRQADLDTRYLPSHPDVQAARAEREDLDQRIQAEVRRASADLAAQATSARAHVDSMQQSMRASSGELRGTSGSSERLHQLEQEASQARQVYESFLQRQQAAPAGPGTVDARLLSHASLPAAPSSPQLRIALAIAIAAGLLLGFGAAMMVELFDKSVKNADDLEAKVGHKAIASIPTISRRMMQQMPPAERHPSGYLVGRPMSAFTEALRVLRTVIVYSKLDFSVKVVAITSALPNEGKTTTSMCLARVAAMSGQKVCVVDCDLRMQSINDIIDIETEVGILQVLAGEAQWRQAIIKDPMSEAHVLPVATAGFTPRDVFGSQAMSRLITDLRAHYDLVILDCAPILAVAETRILVAQADTTVLVARAGKTPVGAMRAAVAQTETAGGSVLGIALNYVLPHWQTYSDSLYFDQSKSYYSVS
jgi:capsular exopolysaccharide synthesis family protein